MGTTYRLKRFREAFYLVVVYCNCIVTQTIVRGWTIPPISQLTVLVWPLITKRASFAEVTIKWPNIPDATIGRFGAFHSAREECIAFPTPVIISTLPKKKKQTKINYFTIIEVNINNIEIITDQCC